MRVIQQLEFFHGELWTVSKREYEEKRLFKFAEQFKRKIQFYHL